MTAAWTQPCALNSKGDHFLQLHQGPGKASRTQCKHCGAVWPGARDEKGHPLAIDRVDITMPAKAPMQSGLSRHVGTDDTSESGPAGRLDPGIRRDGKTGPDDDEWPLYPMTFPPIVPSLTVEEVAVA